jgi:hypothetical protein
MSLQAKLLSGAFVFATTCSIAQSERPKPEYGVALSEGTSWYNGISSSPALGVGFGVYSQFMVSNRISIDPKFMLNLMGGSGLTVSLPPPYPKNMFDITTVKRSSFYFTLLAPVSFHLSQNFKAGIGPQFMILGNSSDQYKSVTAGTDFLIVDNKNILHKYDAGIITSVSYKKVVEVGLMYYYGLMYVVKNDAIHAKNSSL